MEWFKGTQDGSIEMQLCLGSKLGRQIVKDSTWNE